MTYITKEQYHSLYLDLIRIPIFAGKYDAKSGNEHFMYGVSTVVEYVAEKAFPEDYDNYTKLWTENMENSRKEAEK